MVHEALAGLGNPADPPREIVLDDDGRHSRRLRVGAVDAWIFGPGVEHEANPPLPRDAVERREDVLIAQVVDRAVEGPSRPGDEVGESRPKACVQSSTSRLNQDLDVAHAQG